ncbi:hypothetical protein ABG067_007801 [Albugo candida]
MDPEEAEELMLSEFNEIAETTLPAEFMHNDYNENISVGRQIYEDDVFDSDIEISDMEDEEEALAQEEEANYHNTEDYSIQEIIQSMAEMSQDIDPIDRADMETYVDQPNENNDGT